MATVKIPEAGWAEFMRIQHFWNDNYERFLREYPEQFVAINPKTGVVVAFNPDLGLLIDELREHGLQSPEDVAIEWISEQSRHLIL